MKERLSKIIEYKTNGSKSKFAALLGWSPQYLSRMIKGESGIGLTPIISIVSALPEIDARWLLTGEGFMLAADAMEYAETLLALERFLPVMSSEEQDMLASGKTDFSLDTIRRWELALDERREHLAHIFARAYQKQNNVCSLSKAN